MTREVGGNRHRLVERGCPHSFGVGAELLRELVGRGADQDYRLGVGEHVGDPLAQVEAAAVAARDQDHGRARKRVDRHTAGLRVGRFGVVEPAHAGPLAHQLQAMFDPFE